MNECLSNILRQDPPVPCSRSYCESVRRQLDLYCRDAGVMRNTPVPQYSPDGPCWCCCGSLPPGQTAVATAEQVFKPLSTLQVGDQLRVSDLTLGSWWAAPVRAVGRLSGDQLAVALQVSLPDQQVITLILPGDALLVNGDRQLQPANRLRNGQLLMAVDGKLATVLDCAAHDADVQWPLLGDSTVDSALTGRLFNLSGLLCADLGVGLAGLMKQLSTELQVPLDRYSRPLPPFESQ